jgi:protein-S-isoprenylcysteine O-methyltransferase Ste14
MSFSLQNISIPNLLYAGLLLLAYLSFWYSSLCIFKKTEKLSMNHRLVFKIMTLALWNYSLFSLVFLSTPIYDGESSNTRKIIFFLAVLLTTSSIFLFWLAAKAIKKFNFDVIFSENVPESIVKTGPYRYIRHPFYSSYILTYLSIMVMNFDLLVSSLAVFLIIYYYWAASQEEKIFLRSHFNTEYSDHIKKTKMFFPRIL